MQPTARSLSTPRAAASDGPGSDSLWALEQALKSGHVGAVVAWLPPRLRAERLRRLQLAAHSHDGPAFVMREAGRRQRARPPRRCASALQARRRRHARACASSSAAVRRSRRRLALDAAAGPVGGSARQRAGASVRAGGAARSATFVDFASSLRRALRVACRRCVAFRCRIRSCSGSRCTCRLLSLESFAATLAAADASAASASRSRSSTRSASSAANARGAGARRQAGPEAGDRARARAAPRPRPGRSGCAMPQALRPLAHAALAFTPQVVAAAGARAGRGGRHGAARSAGEPALLRRPRSPAATPAAATGAARPRRPHRDRGDGAGRGGARPRRAVAAHAPNLASTRQALAAAPVWLLGPGREHWDALAGHGPAHGRRPARPAARRPGAALRRGAARRARCRPSARRPDPREAIVLPRLFESRLELFARADTTEQVLHGAGVLLARLVAWLAAQHAFVRRFTLADAARDALAARRPHAAATALEIALAEPSRDARAPAGAAARAPGAAAAAGADARAALQADDIVAPGGAEQRAVPDAGRASTKA